MRLIVWNPLTGDEDQLPALPRYCQQRAFHRVVQLSVDRERKGYTVRLISRTSGTKRTPEQYETAVYNTESRFWYSDQFQYEDQALDRFIYGRSYRCAHYDVTGDVLRGIWSYDIANRVLIEARMDLDLMDEKLVPFPISRIAFTDGRVFRLYKGSVTQPYRIEELQYPQGEVPPHGTCTVVKQHTCAPLDNLHEAEFNIMWLFACKGYLMVASKKKPDRRRRRQTLTGWFMPDNKVGCMTCPQRRGLTSRALVTLQALPTLTVNHSFLTEILYVSCSGTFFQKPNFEGHLGQCSDGQDDATRAWSSYDCRKRHVE